MDKGNCILRTMLVWGSNTIIFRIICVLALCFKSDSIRLNQTSVAAWCCDVSTFSYGLQYLPFTLNIIQVLKLKNLLIYYVSGY